jgi:pimeloyl-ACP methyl ester carboxylesterase
MLHHRIYSAGPDRDWVVFVHGAGGSSAVWFRQIRAFREHFNLLLVDLRGHGGSSGVPSTRDRRSYNFQAISREVLEVLDHLKIRSAHFVGVSLGTIIVRTIGEIEPARVSSMIMVGAVTRLTPRSRVLAAIANAVKRFVPHMLLYRILAWIIIPRRDHQRSRIIFIREARKLARAEFLRWFRLLGEVNPLLRFFREKETGIPTLYLMGSEDHMFLPPVRQIVRQHRNSLLRVIQGAGHVVNIDRPDCFNRIAIRFILNGAA